MTNQPPTEYLCEVVEIDDAGRELEGFRDHWIAKTLDDAVVFLDTFDGGADGRYFRYRITEIEVVA